MLNRESAAKVNQYAHVQSSLHRVVVHLQQPAPNPHGLLGTVMGDTFPNHNNNSEYTFFYMGTLDPLGP